MNTYKTLKEKYDQVKKGYDRQMHRATVYLLAITANVERNSEQYKKIIQTAKDLFCNYDEDFSKDPIFNL